MIFAIMNTWSYITICPIISEMLPLMIHKKLPKHSYFVCSLFNYAYVIQLAKVRFEQEEATIEKEFCATFSEFQYLSTLG